MTASPVDECAQMNLLRTDVHASLKHGCGGRSYGPVLVKPASQSSGKFRARVHVSWRGVAGFTCTRPRRPFRARCQHGFKPRAEGIVTLNFGAWLIRRKVSSSG